MSLKKLLSLILCPLLLLPVFCACGSINEPSETTPDSYDAPIDTDTPLCDGKTLKMLVVTSSFGLNTTQHLYDIAKAAGCENIVIGRLYHSGCTLKMHYDYSKINAPEYDYTKNTYGEWVKTEKATLEHGIKDEDWDIIYLQQSADAAAVIDTYTTYEGKDYIDLVKDYIDTNKTNPNARYIWNMTWAFQQDTDRTVFVEKCNSDQMTMYNMIVNCTKERVVPRTDFVAISPTGTAIQNARTSYFGDKLTKDTLHLNDLGRVIAGYTLWATLTGKPLTEVNVGPVKSYDQPETLTLTEADRQVILEAVNSAIANPWEVTPSSYPEAPQS